LGGISSYLFMAFDFVLHLRLIFSSSVNWGFVSSTSSESHAGEVEGSVRQVRGGRSRRLYEGNSGSCSLPDLELVPCPVGDGGPYRLFSSDHAGKDDAAKKDPCRNCGMCYNKELTENCCQFCDPIEPAFLHNDEYPEEWLVYDPLKGVLRKDQTYS